MDAIDGRIVELLRANARLTFAELGRKVGLSAPAVHDRVGKLESSGVLLGYHAVANPDAIGLGVTALVGIIESDTGESDDVASALHELEEVESCYFLAGEESFLVKVRVHTMAELERLIGRINRIPGIARTRTTVALSTKWEGRPQPGRYPD
ncbi:MAG: AsnC family transcriptional regulator [Micromonosporaceae bacterium]|nr:AsnC family transcriptional regulator [Micromonosporaceae bacterium]